METPAGWGEDELSAFIEQAQRNTLATFANLREPYAALRAIDDLFSDILQGIEVCPGNLLSSLLFLRTHSSFKGAARLAISGQLPEAHALMRSCLENALYSVYVHDDEEKQRIWLDREESEQALKECQSMFRYGDVLGKLREIDEAMAQRADNLYKLTICFGAHPNMASVLSNVSIAEKEEQTLLNLSYLTGDSTALRFCLKTCSRVGVCCLEIMSKAFQREFKQLHVLQRAYEVAKVHGL